MARALNRSVVAVVYDRLCTFEFGVATELFGLDRPELSVEWYDFSVVSLDDSPLRLPGGVTMHAPTDLDMVMRAGTVIIPGWKGVDTEPEPPVIAALRAAHDHGARILSICSGVFALASTGLLDGCDATTHWRYTDALRKRFPAINVVPDVLYVDNGQLLTSAGSAAGLDLGLHLIRRDHGAEIANQVARRLVLAPNRDGGQAQFIARSEPTTSADPSNGVGAAVDWALERLDEPIQVADLAVHATMSPRTFARRFVAEIGTSPHRWLMHQRVLAAQSMLETTAHSIDRIAATCGFGTAATLRHHFIRTVRTTPTAYRARFRLSGPGLVPADANP